MNEVYMVLELVFHSLFILGFPAAFSIPFIEMILIYKAMPYFPVADKSKNPPPWSWFEQARQVKKLILESGIELNDEKYLMHVKKVLTATKYFFRAYLLIMLISLILLNLK